MKIVELKQVPIMKRGHFERSDIKMEPHEEDTATYLTLYGLNIEVVRSVNTPKVNNPDIFIAGSLWEMKAPISYNENTLKKHFKKASKQSDNVIFDLRNAKQDATKIEQFVIKKYQEPGRIRRMILIQANGRVLDFFK